MRVFFGNVHPFKSFMQVRTFFSLDENLFSPA